jgi:preprotein translocase subunit YajC
MVQTQMDLFLFQAGGGGGLGIFLLLPLLFIVATFYFQQRKTKRWQAIMSSLKNGDRVTTGGGIRGTIISMKDDAVTLKVPPDNLRLEIAKSAVVSVGRDDDEKKS